MDQLPLAKFEHTPGLKAKLELHWQDCAKSKEGSLDDRLASLTKQFEQRWQHQKDGKEGKNATSNTADANNEGTIKQEIHIFSPVEIILTVKPEAPTKVVATLVNPHQADQVPEHGL